jgi:hypothetical protein
MVCVVGWMDVCMNVPRRAEIVEMYRDGDE